MLSSMPFSGQARPGRRDVAIATLVTALGVLLLVPEAQDLTAGSLRPDDPAAVHIGALLPYWAGVPLFLLVTVPLAWRRIDPARAAQVALAGLLLNLALTGSEWKRCAITFVVAFLFAFAGGVRNSRAVLGAAVALVAVDYGVTFGVMDAVLATALVLGGWGLGLMVRKRKALGDELADRTAELQQMRDERARMEVSADRQRISAELDSRLERRLGDLAALAEADTGDPAERLSELERAGRDTLAGMRELVGVLREDGAPSPTSPHPTLSHLENLVARAHGQLEVEGSPRTLPPAVELSAYRVLEHLLDALEDSGNPRVVVHFGDAAIELRVDGTARRQATAALDRARERIRLHHGTLETQLRHGQASARASLPVHVPA